MFIKCRKISFIRMISRCLSMCAFANQTIRLQMCLEKDSLMFYLHLLIQMNIKKICQEEIPSFNWLILFNIQQYQFNRNSFLLSLNNHWRSANENMSLKDYLKSAFFCICFCFLNCNLMK